VKIVVLLTMTDVIGVGMVIAELIRGIIAIIYIQITAWFIVALIVIF
jgi:hypothetical protein